ncbi:hypothetical protein OROMI_002654 [Orobanche minor]
MASSQTSSHSQKRDQIIDGRLFSRSTVMDIIIYEVEDDDNMEKIISKIEEQGLYRLGRSHPELYDELIVEEFYRVATVKAHSRKHGRGIISISASIQNISICINQDLLVSMFCLPSDGLTMEELESFGSDELLTAYWGLFIGKSSNKDSSPIQDPTPIDDPIPTENPIPVRSPSPAAQSIVQKVDQAFARFIKWKSYRTAPYDVLINWKDLKEEEEFILKVTHSKEILLLQQEPESSPIRVSSEPGPSHAAASTSIRRPESPRSVARKEQLNALGRQSLFLQDAVEALYKVGKEMDWLNLTASEEMESAKIELSKIAEAFSTFPKDLKEAFANFQKLKEQLLLEEQSQLRTAESKTVAVLEFTDSRISDHDAKIHAMAKVISSLDEKLAKFEEQQDNVLKVLRSIDHTVSEPNARKGESQPDSSRVSAQRSPGQESQARSSEHESSHRSSSRSEHQRMN